MNTPPAQDEHPELAALRRDARNLPALIHAAETLFAQGARADAVALLREGLVLAADDFLLHRVLSGFLAAEGENEAALHHAKRAVDLAPAQAEARLHLASLLLSRQLYATALPHFLAYLETEPHAAQGWHMLSATLFQTGQPARAIEAAQRATALAPDNPDYRLHLASLLTARARYGDALSELAQAEKLDAADARIARAASGNHEALGALGAACREAERALELAPENEEYRRHHDLLAKRMGLFTAQAAGAGQRADLTAWALPPARTRRTSPRTAGLAARLHERGRIIYALALRDMRTRHSRSRLGYFWAVFEPISHLLTLGVMFWLINNAPPPIGHSLFEFYCTGLLPYLMFAHISTEVMEARSASAALLMLPKVRTTDIIFAKTFLLVMTEITVGIIVFSAFGLAGYRGFPAHLFPCIGAVLLLALLGMGIGAINMVIVNYVQSWATLFASIVRLLYFASGIYYTPISMPDAARKLLVLNPVLQGVEIFRSGFYAAYDPFWIKLDYLIFWVLISLMLGFGLERTLRRRLKRHT